MSDVQNDKKSKSAKVNVNDGEKKIEVEEPNTNSKSKTEIEAEEKNALDSEVDSKSVNNEGNKEEAVEVKQDEAEEEQVVLTKREVDELIKRADESDSCLDKLLRTRAEFMNYQKRMRKEKENIAQYAVQGLVLELLPEFDNFERAVKLAESPKDIDKFVEGIKIIETQIFKVLEKYGVKPIKTIDKPFDPKLHEAVIEEENNDLPHHTVIEELQRGYLMRERVIRPSKVKVSKRSNNEEEAINDEESNDVNESSSES